MIDFYPYYSINFLKTIKRELMKKNKSFRELFYRSLKETFLIMRFAIILLILGILQSRATYAYSQKTKLSMNFSDAELINVLDKIEEESEFSFLPNEKLFDIDRKIKLAPDYLTKDPDATALMQQQMVTGIVTDASTGEPIPGVNIVVKGTTIGTLTEVNGNYTIEVPNTSLTLQFSFIGYVTQEVALDGRTTLNIALISDIEELSEVVVVGYGTVKKVNLTGAISTVKFDEEIANRPITNASQALGGNVTGVWVSQNSGKPGSDGAQLRVRGWGTLNNSNPLVIIDGVEGDFEQINPNDIESISVLKDAASAAIYGSKAANGVVLITTKMGQKNEKMQVNLTKVSLLIKC